MIGKEIIDAKEKPETKENKLSEIASSELTSSEAKSFWDDKFNKEIPKLSFEELCNEMLWRSEDEFDFDIEPDAATKTTLERFKPDNWELLDIDEKHDAIKDLVKCIADFLGIPEVPDVEFLDDGANSCGFYSERGNYIGINENYLDDAKDIVDTVAHETRHAYQHYRAELLETPQDEIYKFNFDHYIGPEYDEDGFCVNFIDYNDQYVEAEARAFANRFSPEVAL